MDAAISNLKSVIDRIKAPVTDRDKFEKEMARALGKVWDEQREKLMALLGDPPSLANVPQSYWNNGGSAIRKVVVPIFEEIFISQAQSLLSTITVGVDWTLINKRAADWALAHAGELIEGLQKTEQALITDYVNKYYTSGWTLDDVIDHLIQAGFDHRRATTIAITETTRAATQSELAVINILESEYQFLHFKGVWITANDDRVCDICGPRHGKVIDDGDYPPIHVNCRCEVAYDMRVDNA